MKIRGRSFLFDVLNNALKNFFMIFNNVLKDFFLKGFLYDVLNNVINDFINNLINDLINASVICRLHMASVYASCGARKSAVRLL